MTLHRYFLFDQQMNQQVNNIHRKITDNDLILISEAVIKYGNESLLEVK